MSEYLGPPGHIEPARIEVLTGEIPDLLAEISAQAERLGRALHPQTAENLANLVRIVNTSYSNLIEGHTIRPRDVERALAGMTDSDNPNLQQQAVTHYRLQADIDRRATTGTLPDPTTPEFLRQLHRDLYTNASEATLTVKGTPRSILMVPGEWRRTPEQDIVIGAHLPPSSDDVPAFMAYFHQRYAFDPVPGHAMLGVGQGKASRIMAIPAAHHRFNWIHPFADGNGRVSRLMSHAMAQGAGIGAHGLWSISRGLARGLEPGLEGRLEYKRHLAWADEKREGERHGPSNLSLKGLEIFTVWFLKVCLDQIGFMSGVFDPKALSKRLSRYVQMNEDLPPESDRLLQEALLRGAFDRGDAEAILRLPERTARLVLKQVTDCGLLASDTPKGSVSLRFPIQTLDILFPGL